MIYYLWALKDKIGLTTHVRIFCEECWHKQARAEYEADTGKKSFRSFESDDPKHRCDDCRPLDV